MSLHHFSSNALRDRVFNRRSLRIRFLTWIWNHDRDALAPLEEPEVRDLFAFDFSPSGWSCVLYVLYLCAYLFQIFCSLFMFFYSFYCLWQCLKKGKVEVINLFRCLINFAILFNITQQIHEPYLCEWQGSVAIKIIIYHFNRYYHCYSYYTLQLLWGSLSGFIITAVAGS